MKFCKHLQRLIELFDPSWGPYWINYKMLKVRRMPGQFQYDDALLGCLHGCGVPLECSPCRESSFWASFSEQFCFVSLPFPFPFAILRN